MGSGGVRPGAGRPPGAVNKASAKRQEQIAASGATPLEVTIEVMRYHFSIAQNERARRRKRDPKKIEDHYDKARIAAKDAASYVHPSLKSIEHSGPGGGAIEHRIVAARAEVERKLSGLVAAGEADGIPK